MFKSLFGFALAVPALAIVDQAAEIQCTSVVSTDGTIFDIRGIEATTDYSFAVTGGADTLTFNYCDYLTGSSDTYAEKTGGVKIATNFLTGAENILDGDTITGVKFSQSSDVACVGGAADQKNSMTTNLMCDADGDSDADATITSVTLNDACEYVVTMSHKGGCATFDISQYMNWLAENEWCIGIIYLVLGPILAIFGLQWFPYVTASLIAIFIITVVASLGLAFGFMNSTGGLIAVLAVGLLLGILAGCLIRRKIWLMVGLLGLVAGFFSGALVFALIASASGWTAAWGWWVISILMAIVGALVTYWLGKPVVLVATSFVGCYLFVRAWTMFFPGHWPSESQMMSDASNIETDNIFWGFVALFGICLIASICVQRKRMHKIDADLDAYQRA